MSRPQSVVERVEHLLHDSAPDEIAVLLNISEAEVRRIAQLLDERGPADPAPLPAADVEAVAAEVDGLPDEPAIYGDDVRRLLSSSEDEANALARAALLTVAERAENVHDVEDLTAMLGLTGALTDWQPSTAVLAREMAETFTQIDAAVDAITPEQIDARLADVISSAETWGVNATQAPMSEPGDATTGPSKPDTLAPTRPMTRALVEHVNGYAQGGPVAPGVIIAEPDPVEALTVGPVRLVDVAVVAQPLHPAWTIQTVTPVEASDPEQIHNPGCPTDCEPQDSAHEMPRDVTPSKHVHDPFPVADEHGVFHAQCECGTRWDRATCDMCPEIVTALVIAETGIRRHKHHQGAT